ncbi:hypothetical protein FOZ63_004409, partial [Perkinsus olseni]
GLSSPSAATFPSDIGFLIHLHPLWSPLSSRSLSYYSGRHLLVCLPHRGPVYHFYHSVRSTVSMSQQTGRIPDERAGNSLIEQLQELARGCRCCRDTREVRPSVTTEVPSQFPGASQWHKTGWQGLATQGHFAKFSTAVGDAQPAKDNSLLVQGVKPAENAASVETREDTLAVEKNGRGAAVGKQPRVHKRQNTGPLPLPPTLSALRELLAPTAAVWIDMENEPMIAELLATINGTADSLISLGVFNSDNTTNFRIPRHAELQRYAISAAFEDRFPKPLAFAILHQRGVFEVQERQSPELGRLWIALVVISGLCAPLL